MGSGVHIRPPTHACMHACMHAQTDPQGRTNRTFSPSALSLRSMERSCRPERPSQTISSTCQAEKSGEEDGLR